MRGLALLPVCLLAASAVEARDPDTLTLVVAGQALIHRAVGAAHVEQPVGGPLAPMGHPGDPPGVDLDYVHAERLLGIHAITSV